MITIKALKRIIRYINPIMLIMIMLIAVGIFAASVSMSSSGDILKDTPSYTVVNKWYDKNGKKTVLNEFETDAEVTLHTKIPTDNYNDAKLIILTKDMQLNAHTNGKILYRSDDSKYACFGECFNIIDVSTLSENSEIYLQLIPKENMTGSISQTVYLTTQNDFLMHFLNENKVTVTGSFTVLLLLTVYAVWSIQQMIKRKGESIKHIYACCTIFLIIVIAVTKNNISAFLIGSSAVNYLALYSAYMLLPIPMLSCFSTVTSAKHRAIYILQCLTAAYSLLRIALFLAIPAPLSKAVFISHLLLIITIITMIVYTVQKIKLILKARLINTVNLNEANQKN